MRDNIYLPYLEWEFSNFPITINKLKFEQSNWGFSDDTIIEIWRDEKFRLRGKICGNISDFKKNNEIHFVEKGNIVKGQTITGVDFSGNNIELQECFLTTFHTNSLQITGKSYFTEGGLTLDSLRIQFSQHPDKKEKLTRLDWFLCNKIDAHFIERTFRKASQKKIRVGIDEYDESIEDLIGSSSSKDYAVVKLPQIEFIVAKVPEIFLQDQYGLCLEFRNKINEVNENLIAGISHFISFLLGNEIKHIGYTLVNDDVLIESNLETVNNKKSAYSMPPIKFNFQYEWGNFSWLLNQLLPKYLELRREISLDEALSRYWIARRTPLGANLPILASALEIIVEKYLKQKSDYKNEHLPQNEYLTLIGAELKELKNKLSSLKGGEIILNKISGAFRKGVNEKMNHFLSSTGIEIGKSEKEAIALRNKMAHASRDYSDENRAHDDLIYSRVYEVLFHRVILKLLEYDGCYIDYSLYKCPSKYIGQSVGK